MFPKLHIIILISLLSFSTAVAQDSYSPSTDINLEPDFPGAPWPNWMLNPPEYIHGIGVAKFSRYDTLNSFEEAFDFAVQELNANAFMFASVKTGNSPETGHFLWTEFAIGDEYNRSNVYRIDSAVVGKRCFMLVSTKPRPSPLMEYQSIPDQVEWSSWLNPKEEGGEWFFKGQYKIYSYSKQKSWTLAKQDALKRFTEFINTDVAVMQKFYSDEYREKFTDVYFIESRLGFRDIQIQERWGDGEYYYVLLRVGNDRIKAVETGDGQLRPRN